MLAGCTRPAGGRLLGARGADPRGFSKSCDVLEGMDPTIPEVRAIPGLTQPGDISGEGIHLLCEITPSPGLDNGSAGFCRVVLPGQTLPSFPFGSQRQKAVWVLLRYLLAWPTGCWRSGFPWSWFYA